MYIRYKTPYKTYKTPGTKSIKPVPEVGEGGGR